MNVVNTSKGSDGTWDYVLQTWDIQFIVSVGAVQTVRKSIMGHESASIK